RNLTITAGLRYNYFTPIEETNGAMVRPIMDVRDWFNQRQTDMNAGIPSDASPLIGFELAGSKNHRPGWYEPDKNNFAPRLAVVYSPEFNKGLWRILFGTTGQSAIRAGFGVYFHRIGGALATALDKFGSPGLSTTQFSSFVLYNLKTAPRFTGTSDALGTAGLPPISAYLTPPNSATLPFFFNKGAGVNGFMIDNRLSTPYTMSATFSLQRELPKRFSLDITYVGTFGRQSLSYIDLAQYYGYLRDTVSGENLWSAYNRIVDIIGPDPFRPIINPNDPRALASIAPIAFFENLLPNLPNFIGRSELNATQAFYILAANANGSWTAPLQMLDTNLTPGNSPWNRTIDPDRDGFVLFQPQYNSLSTYTNFGSSNYHSLQLSLRRNIGSTLLGINYVLSKSIDNGSAPENNDLIFGTTGADQIQNAFRRDAGRALSNFDLRHNFNAYGVIDLPFGRGHAIGTGTHGLVNQLISGWTITGIWRWRSGFPLSVSNGFAFPTNALNQGPATLVSSAKTEITRRDPSGNVNLFKNPATTLSKFQYTRPGEVGSRNVITGPANFTIDLGINKRLTLPWKENHHLELRATAFNLLNTVNFGTSFFSNTLRISSRSNFGRLTGTAGDSRQFEFAVRYEF
ncbi:MAG: hypothetical protein AB1489_12125, partial [Acidobacteriota bacterium]